MSELVEKVARATDLNTWLYIDEYASRPEGSRYRELGEKYKDISLKGARAAIAAVAEWGRRNFYDDKPLHEFLTELTRRAGE